jgi:hypothetical protein
MKKLLETNIDRHGEMIFSLNKRQIKFKEWAGRIIIDGCNDENIYSQGGVVVYMTKKEYDEISKKF